MVEYWFYDTQDKQLDAYLPALLEKCLSTGRKVVVQCVDDDALEHYDAWIWTYNDISFLAHGKQGCAFAENQPIYLTTQSDDNSNNADIRLYVQNTTPLTYEDMHSDMQKYERCIFLFCNTDKQLMEAINNLYSSIKQHDITLRYLRLHNGQWLSLDK